MTYTLFSALTASTLKPRLGKQRSVTCFVGCVVRLTVLQRLQIVELPNARYHPTAKLLEVQAADGLAL
jgi:hypothetical protein